jgi:dTDP-4-dehydrorhamnose 3,5-epimerase
MTTTSDLLAGLEIRPLKIVRDDRGAVWPMLRVDAPHFVRFGEIYFSEINPGRVKAWRRHHKADMNLVVPRGRIRLVGFDARPDSITHQRLFELELGETNYLLVTVPPGIWNGFIGLGDGPSLVANCSTLPHDESEVERLPADTPLIPYDWTLAERGRTP